MTDVTLGLSLPDAARLADLARAGHRGRIAAGMAPDLTERDRDGALIAYIDLQVALTLFHSGEDSAPDDILPERTTSTGTTLRLVPGSRERVQLDPWQR